jgi:hypothetical protein
MNTLRQKFILLPGILLFGLCAACKTPAPVPAPIPAPVLVPVPVAAPAPVPVPVLTPAPVQPAPEAPTGDPQFRLVFDRFEAKSADRVSLFYTLSAANPRPDVLPMEVRNWHVELNGSRPAVAAMTAIPQGWSAVPAGAGTAAPGRPARGTHFEALPRDTGTLGFRLDLELPVNSNHFDEYSAGLRVSLCWEYEGDKHYDTDLSAAAVFPVTNFIGMPPVTVYPR